jgi:hypothetical protein
MTQQEARGWLAATARSRHAWRLDEIHCTPDDALIYKGGQMGYYVNLRKVGAAWGVEVGTYEGAFPHIGEAAFTVAGRKHFPSPEEAVQWLRLHSVLPESILITILPPTGPAADDDRGEVDPDTAAEWENDPERRALSGLHPYNGQPLMPRGWFQREHPNG